MSDARIAAVVLAAGGSTRMGQPKVLLDIDGEPLIARVVRVATEAGLAPIVVVAGAEIDRLRSVLGASRARVVENRSWAEGLASSICCGIETLSSECDAAVLLLGDQPLVTPDHIRDLTAAFGRGHDPVATRYGEGRGVPVLFGSRWFAELRSLSGDRGARDLLEREQCAVVGDGSPPLDIDTPADYERLRRR